MTSAMNACPQCGTARQGDLRFCASCGFDYWKAAESAPGGGAVPAATAGAAAEEKAAEEKKNRRFGCIGIAVIAVVILGIIGALNSEEEPGTAGASASPEESATTEPTDEASATPGATTPEPTSEPPAETPTPSAIESVPPSPAFEAIALSGTGNAVPRFDIPEDAAAIAEISHSGGANFVVWAVDGSGSQTDLLVNTIGAYSGTVLFDEQAGSHTDAFEVEADGPWTITVEPVTEAFEWDGSEVLSGTGDDVVILDPPSSGLQSTTLTHDGSGNFAVWGYASGATDLLVNEIGNYSGEVLLADGTFLLEITATGSWTASPPQ
jgi:hypothetical protein